MNILEVNNLSIVDKKTEKLIVKDSTFNVKKGETLAIVGESGSGKSLTCRALMRLNHPWLNSTGTVRFNGEELLTISKRAMRKKRGKQMYMIMQNGMTAFDPSRVIGVHLRQAAAEHYNWSRLETDQKLKLAIESVLIKDAVEVLNKYPHQLSGGMLQRIMIALALILEPDLIIADEPTTALDTITQYEVVNQLIGLRDRMGCSMIFVSHDLGVVRHLADELLVMKDGMIIERGKVQSIFNEPKEEYTKYLVSTREALSLQFNRQMGSQ
ncbi:staphylopine uptake ABC transporter ATP-binding protein CntD [Rossellomorea sp. YZS02]|uniref:staphylopine uptake ABC transporter ATP-binding protein CntD n=1 Tax=Rossellomorea sp. YZS02 TaxID=3097358 RepID=UPI002A0EB77A|nr:ABC transporter ATP-binding protein [Rossellomorea sp. YZS02]MDX8345020.1 ABC transporter ATP-binding protein [Rossellomorea sp. YZS02]